MERSTSPFGAADTASAITGAVVSVSAAPSHGFSKAVLPEIMLIAGHGVAGDAHMGETVKHRSRVAVDPSQPNLRQVHFIASELFAELGLKGHVVKPGDLGENILTEGLALIELPRGTVLAIGESARVEITGLRNPCSQIEAFQPGLLQAVLDRAEDGRLIRKAGIMGIVLAGGTVRPGDAIRVEWPDGPFVALERV